MASDCDENTGTTGLGHDAEVVFHSGKVPLWLRLFLLPWMIGMGCLAVVVVQLARAGQVHPFMALLFCLFATVFGLALFGMWFWEFWILYDPSRDMLVHRNKGILGTSQREYPVSEIASLRLVYGVTYAHGMQRCWDLILIFNDAQTKYLACHLPGHPEAAKVAAIAERIGKHLEIVGKS